MEGGEAVRRIDITTKKRKRETECVTNPKISETWWRKKGRQGDRVDSEKVTVTCSRRCYTKLLD